ncbi:hypothetical protein niasHT_037576 [Heterodera trifolii]|uniref:Uncharacterized protein n=1 Tax=Heterodera trifolii TaxID=157864 RepID=A0ABD2IB82_9BILA
MDWVKFDCTQCDEGLNCFRPHRYWKPILCLHRTVENLTSYLREGTSPPFPATTTTSTNETICPPPSPIQSSHSILLFILTFFIFLVFIAQAVQVGALLRRMVKNRIIQRKLQKRMKTLRSQAGRQSMPMVVNFGRTGDGQMFGQVGGRQSSMSPPVLPVNMGGVPPYQGPQTQQREVIYDVPADGGGHEHAEDDEDDDSF